MADPSSPPRTLMGLMPSLITPGFRLVDAGELYAFLSSLYNTGTVTAAGTTAANATRMRYGVNDITVGTANQGVMLPPALPGKEVLVINDTAASIIVYGLTGRTNDTITPNGSVTPAASVTLTTAQVATFI